MKRVLAIAGSDSSGGAGIQADLKTMLACGVHGMSVLTALTAQNSHGVLARWAVPPEVVGAQLDAVLVDGVDAVKVGMLGTVEVVQRVAAGVAGPVALGSPLVLDPVLASSHGQPLLDQDAVEALIGELLPLVTVLTPNLAEAGRLAGMVVRTEADQRAAAAVLLGLGPAWVLVKGGHLPGAPVDLLTDGVTEHLLPAARLANPHTHGTGCTLAAALAAHLALGADVVAAAVAAKEYVFGAIEAGFALGDGIGPVDHGWRGR